MGLEATLYPPPIKSVGPRLPTPPGSTSSGSSTGLAAQRRIYQTFLQEYFTIILKHSNNLVQKPTVAEFTCLVLGALGAEEQEGAPVAA